MNASREPRRPGWTLILGPPGCGKTWRCMRVLDEELRNVHASDIALASFTRAAVSEARSRAMSRTGCADSDLPWFRTVHSMAFRLLDMKREDVFGGADGHAFCKRFGYSLSTGNWPRSHDDDAPEFGGGDLDDWLMSMHGCGRNLMLPTEAIMDRIDTKEKQDAYRLFVERYDRFRQEIGKLDFHDMLEQCLAAKLRPPVSVAIIDEAQDLNPLQIQLIEQWCEPCDRVYVAGDDDQTIFEWAGAEPDWILGLHQEVEHEVLLKQSYRIPVQVHAMAQYIIAQNTERVEKAYYPRPDFGELHIADIVESQIFLLRERRPAFVLARNWYILQQYAADLVARGVPFAAEGHPHWSPLGRPKVLGAIETAHKIANDQPIAKQALLKMLEFIPSYVGKKKDGDFRRILPHGFKKKIESLEGNTIDSVKLRAMNFGPIIDAVKHHGATAVLVRNVNEEHKAALRQLLEAHDGEIPRPRVTLTTVHRSKGRQRPIVVVLSDMATATWENYHVESENRVAYVAVTRTKECLVVCRPETDHHYPYTRFARMVLEDPPYRIDLDLEGARKELAESERYDDDTEEFVVGEWLDIVTHAELYPQLRQLALKFRMLREAMLSTGFEAADARWGAYCHCCRLSG